mgnify:CR=1 FL=1
MTIVAAIWRDTMARELTPGQGQSLLAGHKRAREARDWAPGPVLSNNFGFGGHNGSIIIAPAD